MARGDVAPTAGLCSITRERSTEAAVATGAILLAFLAALVAFGWIRVRRRMGMGVTGRHFGLVFVGFCLIVLAMWAATRG